MLNCVRRVETEKGFETVPLQEGLLTAHIIAVELIASPTTNMQHLIQPQTCLISPLGY